MDRTERFYRIELLIKRQAGVSFDQLLAELEVSPATLKRDLQYLRDRMDAPIVYARDDNVYRFAEAPPRRPTAGRRRARREDARAARRVVQRKGTSRAARRCTS